jgi:two-component system, cell cycle sensor histidine kinase and response regulator CckA
MLSGAKLLSLIDALGGIVWEAEPETFRFLFVSAEAERILGFPAQTWLDEPDFWVRHTHPDDIERCASFCRDASRRGEDHQFEYRMIAADGRIVWLRDIVSVRKWSDGSTRLVGIALDITREKQDQLELEATQEQLAEAMKMEAVGRLAGGVAHDFNNLLTVIAGYAELVSATLDTADFRSEDLGEIKRAAHRASLLTRQLLAFSRKQVLRPEVLDINSVVRDVGLIVRRLIGEDIQLVIETAPSTLPVRGDRSQLEQVLMNLAVNARDAMPKGGRLIVRTDGRDSTVYLIVTDNGTGMPQAVLDRVFEPFFTTKDVGKGTGLGLSTAYGIVKQTGGDIQVQSEMNKGTVFTISLPMARELEEPGAAAVDDMPGGTETILLVEADDQVREVVEQVLLRLGYDVLTAADGIAAIEVCRRQQKISLLITDVVMPHASGPQVYGRVSAIVPDMVVLYISGYTGESVLARSVREEGVAYLQKPFTPKALALRVREVLDDAKREARAR